MPIQVTCPGCLSRFSVSDKYAGKKGPCPKCKKEIVIPDKSQQVVIHAPETSGPKDSKGVSILKPLRRQEFVVSWKAWLAVGLFCSLAIGAVLGLRLSGQPLMFWHLSLGAILLAPPVAMFGYTFLRDDDLEGYSGREYLIRLAICSVLFAATWLLYYLSGVYFEYKTLAEIPVMHMAVAMFVMIAIGTGISVSTFELEVGQSILHYLGYFLVSFLLAWGAGLALGEPLAAPKATSAPNQGIVPRRPIGPIPKKSVEPKPASSNEAPAKSPSANTPSQAAPKKLN